MGCYTMLGYGMPRHAMPIHTMQCYSIAWHSMMLDGMIWIDKGNLLSFKPNTSAVGGSKRAFFSSFVFVPKRVTETLSTCTESSLVTIVTGSSLVTKLSRRMFWMFETNPIERFVWAYIEWTTKNNLISLYLYE